MSPEKKVRLAIAKFEGFSTAECAEILEVSVSTVQRVLRLEERWDVHSESGKAYFYADSEYARLRSRIEKLMTEEIVWKHMGSRSEED